MHFLVLLQGILELPVGFVVFIVIILLKMKAPLYFICPEGIIPRVFEAFTGGEHCANCSRGELWVEIIERGEESGAEARLVL